MTEEPTPVRRGLPFSSITIGEPSEEVAELADEADELAERMQG